MYGSFTERSTYAYLVMEAVEGGGMLIFVRQHQGSTDGEARINLSADQVSAMRTWMESDQAQTPNVSRDVARVLEDSARNRAALDDSVAPE